MTGPDSARRRRLEELAGEVLVVGLPGPDVPGALAARLLELGPGGVILFARNVVSAEQLGRLGARLHDLLDAPLILIDQEGGRVDRLRGIFGPSPSARACLAAGLRAVSERARATALRLRGLGVTMNLAPVVDLDEGEEGNGIGDRCASPDPAETAAAARAVIEAHAAEGVLTCLKHFPGLGRTRVDSHLERPSVTQSLTELAERELVPYRMLADTAPAVMVAHVALPEVTGTDEPASLSRDAVEGLLRRDLGYSGLVLTDDLEMGAVAAWPAGERGVRALRAGADLLLYCGEIEAALAARDAVVRAVLDGVLAGERLAEAASRVRAARRALQRAGLA